MSDTSPEPRPTPPTDADVPDRAPLPVRTLSLVKGDQQFYFRYEPGSENEVLRSLVELVNRRDVAFDWFDAAVLSHQLGQHLTKEIKGFLPKKAA